MSLEKGEFREDPNTGTRLVWIRKRQSYNEKEGLGSI